jgi:hypothetical protein
VAAAFVTALAAFIVPSASAAPVTNSALAASATDDRAIIIKVQRRGRGGAFRGRAVAPGFRAAPRYAAPRYIAPRRYVRPGPRYYRRPGWGRGVAIGAGVVAGAFLLSEAARASYRRSGAWQRCADDFVSFDWDTGTIVTYDGEVVLCPYLR